MGGLADAGFWAFAWAIFAVAAGIGLAAAAVTLLRRAEPDFGAGYNALAPIVDR